MADQLLDKWQPALGRNLLRAGNQVDFFLEGAATFKAMLEAMLTAKRQGHYIYLLGWYLDINVSLTGDDKNFVRDILIAALGKNVQFRAMLWKRPLSDQNVVAHFWLNQQMGSFDSQGRAIVDCAAILDELTVPLPLLPDDERELLQVASSASGPKIDISLGFGSHHQKVLLVRGEEGLIAFCGGIDINDDRILTVKEQPGSPMHDVHCRIKGPAAYDLVDVFLRRWRAHPDHVAIDKMHQLVGLTDRGGLYRATKGNQYVRIACNINVVKDSSKGDVCYSEHSIENSLIAAIRASRRFIYIEDQYLGHLGAAAAIRDQLPNLQHVTIVVPHPTIEPVFPWRRYQFLKLLGYRNDQKGKVKICYRYNKNGPRFGPFSYIHSKTWIFDDEVAIIGSANCNRRGWGFDSEVIAAILDVPPATSWPPASFAQKLRIALWTMHLGVDEKQLLNGYSESVRKLWEDPPYPKASVLPYFVDPNFDYRATALWVTLDPQDERSWGLVDPDGAQIKPCGKQV